MTLICTLHHPRSLTQHVQGGRGHLSRTDVLVPPTKYAIYPKAVLDTGCHRYEVAAGSVVPSVNDLSERMLTLHVNFTR